MAYLYHYYPHTSDVFVPEPVIEAISYQASKV